MKPQRGPYRRVPLPVWTVLEACWEIDPSQRPTASTIVRGLEVAKEEITGLSPSFEGSEDDDIAMQDSAERVCKVMDEGRKPCQERGAVSDVVYCSLLLLMSYSTTRLMPAWTPVCRSAHHDICTVWF